MKDLVLGDTEEIIAVATEQGVLRNQLAYILATAFWETARTIKPVREAYWLDEEWRKKNLRYYPWYGRGYVQLTWEENYKKAAEKLEIPELATTPDYVMKPDIAAQILVAGMLEGWFTGKKLSDYITLQSSDYVGARKIINGTDKDITISNLAQEYDTALKKEGYGVDKKRGAVDSNTLRGTVTAGAGGIGAVTTGVSSLDGTAQIIVAVAGGVLLLGLAWVARERIKKGIQEGW